MLRRRRERFCMLCRLLHQSIISQVDILGGVSCRVALEPLLALNLVPNVVGDTGLLPALFNLSVVACVEKVALVSHGAHIVLKNVSPFQHGHVAAYMGYVFARLNVEVALY